MVLPPYLNGWSELRGQEDKCEQAANHLLEDMQRFLPNPLDPTTLSAMRNYMMTRYGQTQDCDKLVMRHDAIKSLIRDVEGQLAELNKHARDLAAAFDHGVTGEEALLRRYGFSEANFRIVLDQIVNVRARISMCDADYMILQTRTESLEQDVRQYKALLEISAQQRAREKEEELVRSEHIVERVKAEYDRSRTTADYVIYQADDLERRLQKTEKLYEGTKRALDHVMGERSQQGQMSIHREMPKLARFKTWPTSTSEEPSMNPQRNRESRQDTPVESESRSGSLVSRLISGISETVVNDLEQIGEASLEGWRP